MAKAKKVTPKKTTAKKVTSVKTTRTNVKRNNKAIDEIFNAIKVAFELIENSGMAKKTSKKSCSPEMDKMMQTIDECVKICDMQDKKETKAKKPVAKTKKTTAKSSVAKKKK